jgi:hypothetical protein
VETVMLDLAAGRIAYVIFTPDDTLALKHTLCAVPPSALTPNGKNGFKLDADREKLASVPAFGTDNWSVLSHAAWGARLYQHFGQVPYFKNGETLQRTSGSNRLERIYHEPGETMR